MPQGDKSAEIAREKRQVAATRKDSKGIGRPGAEVRASAPVNKPQGGGKNNGAGRKVPFGPVGGSGRKTNLARSS
ncbi:hypothetical protein ACPWT1_20265 [Ramlibacter sp. MMS24-I3-19]|uniref:hypothetical protein n=1 Tax=Ramlibacter sp. MMS24-I3-19 TaxID=3416606 RepID=UPI003CFF47D5